MEKCKICNIEFKNNLGGQFTNHLKKDHCISFEDYYVKYLLNGIEPKCKCGYCNERPKFYRGKFSKFAIGHNKFNWIEKNFIEKYGNPKCKNINCNNIVKFNRGKPNKYCSFKCHDSNWNQDKVKDTVRNKYGVSNVFQLEEIKSKSKKTLKNKYGVESPMLSNEIKNKVKTNNLVKYGVDHPMKLELTKNKLKNVFLKKYGVDHISKTSKFKENASKNMCKYNSNTFTNHKIKKFKDTCLYYQSQYEYRFLELCEKHKIINLIENAKRFLYLDSDKWHIPDFKFKDKYIIEIKSSYWLKRQGGTEKLINKKKSVEACGYKYIFILDQNYENFITLLN